MLRAVLVTMLVLAGCDVRIDVGDGGTAGGGGTGGGGSTGGGGGSPWATCSASMACPSGQFCFNGICAIGCQSNGDCASDQYCDTQFDRLCHNKVVQTCTGTTGCLSTQTCISGFCSTPPPPTQCDPNAVTTGMDGCDRNSVCYDPPETSSADPKCYSFPPCAEDKTCPTGTQGALCNDGLIPNKAHICLTGLCRDGSNCPANWGCVKFNPNDVVGYCSNKGPGSPCAGPGDCNSGTCMTVAPGFPGVCT